MRMELDGMHVGGTRFMVAGFGFRVSGFGIRVQAGRQP